MALWVVLDRVRTERVLLVRVSLRLRRVLRRDLYVRNVRSCTWSSSWRLFLQWANRSSTDTPLSDIHSLIETFLSDTYSLVDSFLSNSMLDTFMNDTHSFVDVSLGGTRSLVTPRIRS